MDSPAQVKITALVPLGTDPALNEATLRSCLGRLPAVAVAHRELEPAVADAAEALAGNVLKGPAFPSTGDGLENTLKQVDGAWILLLCPGESMADDALPALGELLESAPASTSAFALPVFSYIGEHIVRTKPFYPAVAVRLLRNGSPLWSDVWKGSMAPDGVETVSTVAGPHIHDKRAGTLSAFVAERARAMAARAPVENDDFAGALARAYARYAERHDQPEESNLATVLAVLGAWEELIGGIKAWDAGGRTEDLEGAFALPVGLVQRDTENSPVIREMLEELQKYHDELWENRQKLAEAQGELDRVRGSKLWKLCGGAIDALDRLRGIRPD